MKQKFEDIVTKSVIKTINRILKGYELSGKSAVFVAARCV